MRLAVALLLLVAAPPGRVAALDPPATPDADYVIVGGGTAGCVLAARLCEALPLATVTLLERGPARNDAEEALVRQMRQAGETWKDPRLTEAFASAPVEGLLGRELEILTGATLGGSSAINAGQWSTPGLEEVAGWGFPGFTEASATRYYATAAARVGAAVPRTGLRQDIVETWLEGAAAVGIDTSANPLALSVVKPTFATYSPIAADTAGRRRDACTAYLEPVRRGVCGRNLEVVQSAVVSKIEVEGGRATGVTYLKTDAAEGQQERRLGARRAVVSSAGPYGSPKLLQLSGIGPAPLLQSLGIPLVEDLPVGQAVQGRVVGQLIDIYTAVPLVPEANTTVLYSRAAADTWAAGGGGPLGVAIAGLVGALRDEGCVTGGTVAIGSTQLDTPALAIIGVPNAVSRGTLAITGRDPMAPPAVDLNFLSAPGEAAAVAECLTRLDEATEVIRPDLGMFNVLPGIPTVNETHVRATSENSYHFASGCAVGSVVDGEFRVRGVDGLRVVDVSVIPKLPDGSGLMASVYALAEHAADLIIGEAAACRGFTDKSDRSGRGCGDGKDNDAAVKGVRTSSMSVSSGGATASAQANGAVSFAVAETRTVIRA